MKRRLVILLLLVLLTVAAAVAVRYRTCFFATSEVFRRYEHAQGIEADYIRNYPINDTLRLDMTLLVAEDSLAFVNLLRDFGKSEDAIHTITTIVVDENTRYVGIYPRDKKKVNGGPAEDFDDIEAIFPLKHTIAIIHLTSIEQEETILFLNYTKSFNI